MLSSFRLYKIGLFALPLILFFGLSLCAMNYQKEQKRKLATQELIRIWDSAWFLKNESQFDSQIRELIKQGANVNVREEGTTLLSEACLNDRPNLVRLLIQSKADINGRNDDNSTALMCAVDRDGHLQSAVILIAHGSNTNAKDSHGWTPLHYALATPPAEGCFPNPLAVRLLIANGANPNLADKNGNTPLFYVDNLLDYYEKPDYQTTSIASLLLKKGANPMLKNKKGQTAVDYLKSKKNSKLNQTIRLIEQSMKSKQRGH